MRLYTLQYVTAFMFDHDKRPLKKLEHRKIYRKNHNPPNSLFNFLMRIYTRSLYFVPILTKHPSLSFKTKIKNRIRRHTCEKVWTLT